jgi:hypothetical protein
MVSIIMPTQPLQLRDFQVRFTLPQTRTYPIENINELNEMIRIYGRGIISYITFFFHDNEHKYHTLTLYNSGHNDKFIVEFCHYYNQQFDRVELSLEEKVNDFTVVMNCLTQNVNARFVQHIINPFVSRVMA